MKALATLLLAVSAIAQDAPPQFEVASIKPAAPNQRGMTIRPLPGGRVEVNNMSLKELMVIAYRVQPFQVSGADGWIASARFDISAKPETATKVSDVRPMLQALLADRFALKFHREIKELPIYALVVARKDGKLGPGLTRSQESGCQPMDPAKPIQPGTPSEPGCGFMQMGRRELKAVSVPVANLIPMLSRTLGRTIVDDTGLTGNYDVSLTFSLDEAQLGILTPPGAPPAAPLSDAGGPSIFTALQEQLGLKLESRKGPVEILIVDHAEKPSGN